MDTWLIVLLVALLVVVVLLLATSPLLKRKERAALRTAKDELGEDLVAVRPRAVGFGTKPEASGGLRGMGVLAASEERIFFVTWAPQRTFSIDRSAVVSVGSPVEDVENSYKAMIEITYADGGDEVTASFRVVQPAELIEDLSS